MDEEKRFKGIDMKFFIGLAVLLAGGFLLIQNMDMSPFEHHIGFWRLWPLLLVSLGIGQLAQPAHSRNVTAGLIMSSVGGYFLLYNLRLIDVSFTQMWPVLLIIVGGLFLYRAFVPGNRRCGSGSCDDYDSSKGMGDGKTKVFADYKDNIDSDFIDISLVLSGSENRILSKNLTGGRLEAVLGSIELDLWEADIKGNTLKLDAHCVLGSIELRVPRDWEVTVHGSPVMGSVENKTVPPSAPGKKLVVKASTVMGSVEVKN